jgi:hypothetical protein
VYNANNVKGLDGANVQAGVAFDSLGNLYGETVVGGANKLGIVWKVFSNPVPQKLILKPTKVVGGTSTICTIEFSSLAPDGGANVTLSSTSPFVKSPTRGTPPPGRDRLAIAIPTLAVPSDINATITAELNGESASVVLHVSAPTLAGVAVFPTKVVGSRTVKGTVTLTSPAPAGGMTVHLSSSSLSAKTPLTVRVAPGAKIASFSITTSKVTSDVVLTISAVLGSVTHTAQLTLTH